MTSKKKHATQSSQQRTPLRSPHKKSIIQRHSRRPTLQLLQPSTIADPSLLLISHFRKSKILIDQQELAFLITSLVQQYPEARTLETEEILDMSREKEYCSNFFQFGKGRNSSKSNLEVQLMQGIRKNEVFESNPKILPHFGAPIYPIIKKYQGKMKKYERKVQLQGGSSINRYPKSHIKQGPTLNTLKDETHSGKYQVENSCTNHHSQSFELNRLADCIRKMFDKQTELYSAPISEKNNWLKQRQPVESPLLNCDFSSIQMHSKLDLIEDSVFNKNCQPSEAEEMYGLANLKQKYEDEALSTFKLRKSMEGSERHNFGHKRNPTDVLYNHKEICHYDPLTPRELIHRPTLGSFKNLPPNSSRKTSKSKDPYLLNKFQKPKKASKVTTLKENKEKEKDVYLITGHKPSKSQLQPKSKSKSKQKLRFKSPLLKNH